MNEKKNIAPWGFITLPAQLLLVVLVSGVITLWLTVLLNQALDPESFIGNIFLNRGPHKLWRRLWMVLMAIGMLVVLRKTCWQGWRDLGLWKNETGTLPVNWRRALGMGWVYGVITLGVFAIINIAIGARALADDVTIWGIIGRMAAALASGLLIGVLEEVMARGIFFISLARRMAAWWAAVFSSLIFAIGHFLKARPEAFDGPTVGASMLSAATSVWNFIQNIDHLEFRMLNMLLMSCFLCYLVWHTRTIWAAAGLHAGWVWVKKVNEYACNGTDKPYGIWTGRRSDITDSLGCTLLILALFAIVYFRTKMSRRAAGPNPG